MVDVARVVQVWAPGLGGSGGRASSGHLVGDRAVLTAWHATAAAACDAGGVLEVRLFDPAGQSGWMRARRVWPTATPDLQTRPGLDVALLEITDPRWVAPTGLAPVRFGRIATDAPQACRAVAFPRSELRPDRVRGTKDIEGRTEPHTALGRGLVVFTVTNSASPRAEAWSGGSGAAVYCGEAIVGVLILDQHGYQRTQLRAANLAEVLAATDLANALRLAGVEPDTAPVEPAAGAAPGRGTREVQDLPPTPQPVGFPGVGLCLGRARELDALHGALGRGAGPVVVQAVHGLGGIGKTTLAAQYVAAHGRDYRQVVWITADGPVGLTAGLVRLTRALAPGLDPGLPDETLADLAVGWLAANSGWLVVLDNVTDPRHIRALVSAAPTGRFLATSRRATGWAGIAEPIALDLLAEADAQELLARIVGGSGTRLLEGAEQLCARLGFLPLAVEQAGAYLAERHVTAQDYLRLLDGDTARTLADSAEGADPDGTVARVWTVTLDALSDTPLCGVVLRTAAFFAPDAIPLDLFADLGGQVEVLHALGRLRAYSMLTDAQDGAGISVHRLVQEVTRTPDEHDRHRTPALIQEAHVRATQALARRTPDKPFDPSTWPAWRALVPHTQAYAAHTDPAADNADACDLLTATARYLQGQGDYRTAIGYCERALAAADRIEPPDLERIGRTRYCLASAYQDAGRVAEAVPLFENVLVDYERVLGPDHDNTLNSRGHLAHAYRNAGRLTEATTLYESLLADLERILGPDHPNTLNSRNGLATAYANAGRHAEALALHEAALPDFERVLGSDHHDTLTCRSNLAKAYQDVGRVAEAVPLLEAVLADRERVLGADHRDTLTSRSDLAKAYQDVGRVAEAVALYEAVLADYERVLGADHRDALTSRNLLASAYLDAGRLAESVALCEVVLADRERILGPDHPDTLDSRNNLAAAYQHAGRPAEALPLLEAVLADRERILGPDHPDTLISRNNLAYAYADAGRLGEAIPLFEAVLGEFERILGPDHPNTLAICNNLAAAYLHAGRPAEALPLLEAVLADRERILGPDHPDTLASRNNLAVAYQAAGRLTEATFRFETIVADCERIYGPDHPNTFSSRDSLADAYRAAGRRAEALLLYEAVLADRERILGPDHPNTLVSRNNLAAAYQHAGREAEALPLFEAVLGDVERILGPDHPNTLISRNNLASAYLAAGRLDQATPMFEAAVADFERVLGPDHPNTLISRNSLANAYQHAGRLDEALLMFEAAVADFERVLGPYHPNTLISRNSLASTYRAADRLTDAIPLYLLVLADRERVLGPDHPDTVLTRQALESIDSTQQSLHGGRSGLNP